MLLHIVLWLKSQILQLKEKTLPESGQSKGRLHKVCKFRFLSSGPCCSWAGCKAEPGTRISQILASRRPLAGGSGHLQCQRLPCCTALPWVWSRTSAAPRRDSFAPSYPCPNYPACTVGPGGGRSQLEASLPFEGGAGLELLAMWRGCRQVG